MGVIITDMYMPYSCYECRFRTRCEYALANGWLGNKRDDNCPLKPYEERKTGKWIDHSEDGYVECPLCGHLTTCNGNIADLHYCFWCGAKMVADKKGSETE